MPRQPARTPEEILFSLIEYFNARVKKMPNGCWEWQGSLSKRRSCDPRLVFCDPQALYLSEMATVYLRARAG